MNEAQMKLAKNVWRDMQKVFVTNLTAMEAAGVDQDMMREAAKELLMDRATANNTEPPPMWSPLGMAFYILTTKPAEDQQIEEDEAEDEGI